MKKLLFLLIILAIIGAWWYSTQKGPSTHNTIVNTNPVTNGHPDPSNATFTIDDTKVILKDGSGEMPIGESPITQGVDLTNITNYGDLNSDGKEDAAFFLVTTNPASGAISAYVAAYISGPVTYKTTNAIAVGTQVTPKAIVIKGNTLVVTYLDRRPDEPLTAEPTVLTSKTFVYNSLDNTIE